MSLQADERVADTASHRGGRRRGLGVRRGDPDGAYGGPRSRKPAACAGRRRSDLRRADRPRNPHVPLVGNPAGIVCYSPSFIRQAYDFPTGRGAPSGAGQTILVVEAYGSPTIADDLANFDEAFGLPAPPSLTVVNATGTGAEGSGDTVDWGAETSLDVEYAHAAAPGAAIVLAVAATRRPRRHRRGRAAGDPAISRRDRLPELRRRRDRLLVAVGLPGNAPRVRGCDAGRRHADRLHRRFRRDRRERLRRGVVSGLRPARHRSRGYAGAALPRRALERAGGLRRRAGLERGRRIRRRNGRGAEHPLQGAGLAARSDRVADAHRSRRVVQRRDQRRSRRLLLDLRLDDAAARAPACPSGPGSPHSPTSFAPARTGARSGS